MKTINVILIEENIKNASLINKHLASIKEVSFQVHHFTEMNKAEEYIRHNSPSIILLSLNYSNARELEKIRLTRKIAPSLPIVVLIESNSSEFYHLVISVGADDYLLKDSLNHELTLRTLSYSIDRKNYSEKINEGERKYKELVSLLPQTVFEMNIEGSLTFVNDSSFQTFGYNREEFADNLSAFQMVEEKDRERAAQNIQKVMKGFVNTDNEYSMLKKDGSTFPALIFSNPIVRDGEILGLRGIIIDITERKRSEKAEERFKSLFENTVIGLYRTSPEGKVILANPALIRMLGFNSFDELAERNLEANGFEPKYPRIAFKERIEKEGTIKGLEAAWEKADGSIIYIRENATAIKDEKGNTIFYEGVIEDITERKRIELALQKSEENYRNFFDDDLTGDYKTTPDGKMLMCNNAFVKIVGCHSIEQVLQKNASEFYIDQTDRDEFLKKLKEKGKLELHELTLRGCDGRKIHVVENVVGKYDEKGELVEITGYLFDITDRKKSEMALIESEKKYRQLIENAAELILLTDKDGNFTFANDTALKFSGYTFQEITSFNYLDLVHEDHKKKVFVFYYRQLIRKDETTTLQFPFYTKSGEIKWLEQSVKLNMDGDEVNGFQFIARDITERKILEDTLNENLIRMRGIIEGTPHLFFYTQDSEGNNTYASPTIEKITGYSVDRWLNKKDWFVTDSEINKIAKERTRTNLRGEQTNEPILVEVKHAEGSIIFLEVYESPIFRDGKVIGLQGVAHDITERKNAEKQILLLSRAVDKSPATIIITDENGNIEYVNQKFIDLTGYSFEEVKGKKPSLLKSGYTSAEEYQELWDTVKAGNTWKGEFHNKKKNGELYWESALITPIKNDRLFLLALKEDITERKKTEALLKESEERFEQVTSSSEEWIWEVDVTGLYTYSSIAVENLLGYSPEEIVGKKRFYDLFVSEIRDEIKEEVFFLMSKNENIRNLVNPNQHKNGAAVYLETNGFPLLDSDGRLIGYRGVDKDITERRRIQKELILAKEKAEQSDKLKSEFLAQMSHEIRTPLNILLSFSTYIKEILEERNHLTEDIDQYFTTTKSAGKRIIRTIELILNMSDLKSGSFVNDPKCIDIFEDIVIPVFHQFYHAEDVKKIKFDVVQKSNSLFAFIDQYAVEQVLIHLIDNAIKFTEKGHVIISAEKNQTSNVVINIEDTGIGIGEEYMKKLYTPFTQEDHGYSRSFDGNGLGLALVKKYCELNNIEIDVQSEKGKGTLFTLTFPK